MGAAMREMTDAEVFGATPAGARAPVSAIKKTPPLEMTDAEVFGTAPSMDSQVPTPSFGSTPVPDSQVATPGVPVKAMPKPMGPEEQTLMDKMFPGTEGFRNSVIQGVGAVPTLLSKSVVGVGQLGENIGSAMGLPNEGFRKHAAGVSAALEKTKEEKMQGMGIIERMPYEILSDPATYITLGKAAQAAKPVGNALASTAANLWQGAKSVGAKAWQGTKTAAKMSAVSALIDDTGNPDQGFIDRVQNSGLAGLFGAGTGGALSLVGSGVGIAGKGVAALVNAVTGGITNRLVEKGGEKLAGALGTPAGAEFKALSDAGITLRPGSAPEEVYQDIFKGKDASSIALLDTIAPRGVGATRQGNMSPGSVGWGAMQSFDASKALKTDLFTRTKAIGDGMDVTKYPQGPDGFFQGLLDLRRRVDMDVNNNVPGAGQLAGELSVWLDRIGVNQAAKNQPVKVNVGQIMQLNSYKNREYEGASNEIKSMLAQLGEQTGKIIDDARGQNKQFDKLYPQMVKAHNAHANAYETKIAKQFGMDDDGMDAMHTMARGFPLNTDQERKLRNIVDNMVDIPAIHQLKISLSKDPGAFDALARTKMAGLLAESSLDPAKFSINREMMDEIISLSGTPGTKARGLLATQKDMLNKQEALNKTLADYGIGEEFTKMGGDGLTQGQMDSIKKAALGALTKHYAFALSQGRNALYPPLPAAERRLLGFGKTVVQGAPAARVGQDIQNKIPTVLRNVPAAAIGTYFGDQP